MRIGRFATHALLSVFCSLIFVVSSLFSANAQQSLPDSPKPKIVTTPPKQASESSWPRTFASDADAFTIYQPQVDKWDGNLVDLYCAVELKEARETATKYGVVWIQARTEVDKINRLVTLDQAKITKVKFPVAADKEPQLTALLERKLPGATRTISLDRLEAALEADSDVVKGVDVKNDAPKVIIATKPSMLVLIDGTPQMGDVPGTKLQSVINTRSIILYDSDERLYFLRVQERWLQAKALEGPWKYAQKLSDAMKRAEEIIVSQNSAQKPDGGQTSQQPSLKRTEKKVELAETPAVYVVFEPTEMIESKGEPTYNLIPGTGLQYVVNTNGNSTTS